MGRRLVGGMSGSPLAMDYFEEARLLLRLAHGRDRRPRASPETPVDAGALATTNSTSMLRTPLDYRAHI